MPITKSAKKAVRAGARRKDFNDRNKKVVREAIKAVTVAIKESAPSNAKELLSRAYKAIDKAVKRGVLKKNTAARKKAQVARAINQVLGNRG